MKKMMLVLLVVVPVVGCSSKQVAETAYGSAKSSECMKKEGELQCDLDNRNSDVSLISSPNENTNEALERRAEKIRSSESN